MSRILILVHLVKNFKPFNVLFTSTGSIEPSIKIGGGGGNSTLGGPYGLTPVFGTGDFSNSSTPPHLKTLGAPPRNRTAHTEVATRPLAICCCGAWHPRGDSNTQARVWNPLASPSATGAYGAPGWIRTSTRPVLSGLPLPVGLRAHGRLGRIRTDTGHGLSVLPLPS